MIQFSTDFFDNSSKGLFAILDYECVMHSRSVTSFTQKVVNSWSRKLVNRAATQSEFIISHFAGDVEYATVSRSIYHNNKIF